MTTAEQNYRLLQEIEANRRFLLMAYQQNPKLLESAEARIKQLFEAPMLLDHTSPLSCLSSGGRRVSLPSTSGGGIEGGGRQRGISFIELIIFIVIISVALTGILQVMNLVTRHSADPLRHKQAIVAAESLLEEIELQDFISASNPAAACPQNAVTQANRATGYHIVCDYDTFATNGIFPTNDPVNPIVGLENYNANVTVVPTVWNGIPAGSAVLITVIVTTTDLPNDPIQISGYRTAY